MGSGRARPELHGRGANVGLEKDLPRFWFRPLIMVSAVYAVFLPKGYLWPGSSEHVVPAPPERHHPRHSPRESGSAEPKKRVFALSDSHRIPSQRSRASLKQQAETIRQTQRLSCRRPFCYSALLFSVSSSPPWSAGINLDVVHGAPKYHVYRTSLRSQCLGGTHKNKIQPADVGSKREDRNIPMAVSIWRVKEQNDLFNSSASVQTCSLLLSLLLQDGLRSRWN